MSGSSVTRFLQIKTVYSKIFVSNPCLFRNVNSKHFSSSRRLHSPIDTASVNNEKEIIQVKFANGSTQDFPWIFLQDNCTCSECFHVSSQSRKKLMTDLDLEKKIRNVKVNPEKENIQVEWSDGHQGTFSEKWLIERNFSEEYRKKQTKVLRDEPELFGSDYEIQREIFHEVLKHPNKLLNLLKILCTNGVFILESAPKEVGQLRKFVEKIGFIRTTHYGNEFTVKSERSASNMAYTASTLCVHTDLPYYVYPPCVQLLHCIKQYEGTQEDSGGESHLVDGFQVAKQLKREFPESYDVLSTIPLEFADLGQDFTKFDKVYHSPTFVHSSSTGKLTRIVYSNQQLSSRLPIPIEKVKPLYAALKLFTNICYKPENLLRFKLKEGDIMIFDNWRILHGREGFDPSKGDRHLEGCYVDWDEIYSTIRVLESESSNSAIPSSSS